MIYREVSFRVSQTGIGVSRFNRYFPKMIQTKLSIVVSSCCNMKTISQFFLILFFRHTADSSYNYLIKNVHNLHLSGVNCPRNQNNGAMGSVTLWKWCELTIAWVSNWIKCLIGNVFTKSNPHHWCKQSLTKKSVKDLRARKQQKHLSVQYNFKKTKAIWAKGTQTSGSSCRLLWLQ